MNSSDFHRIVYQNKCDPKVCAVDSILQKSMGVLEILEIVGKIKELLQCKNISDFVGIMNFSDSEFQTKFLQTKGDFGRKRELTKSEIYSLSFHCIKEYISQRNKNLCAECVAKCRSYGFVLKKCEKCDRQATSFK